MAFLFQPLWQRCLIWYTSDGLISSVSTVPTLPTFISNPSWHFPPHSCQSCGVSGVHGLKAEYHSLPFASLGSRLGLLQVVPSLQLHRVAPCSNPSEIIPPSCCVASRHEGSWHDPCHIRRVDTSLLCSFLCWFQWNLIFLTTSLFPLILICLRSQNSY